MIRQTITTVAVSLALAAPVWAGRNQADQPPSAQALTQAQQRLAQAQQGAGKPGHALAIERQRQDVQKLLDQLEAGQNVDPAEVQRVLRQSKHPY